MNVHEQYYKSIALELQNNINGEWYGLLLKDTLGDNSIWVVSHSIGWSDNKKYYKTLAELMNKRLPGLNSRFELIPATSGDLKKYA